MSIILKILSLFGWQKLLGWAWGAVLPTLKKQAEKTETQLDDDILSFVDKIINELVTTGDVKKD